LLDITAIMTIHGLGIENKIAQSGFKLLIAQATVDVFTMELEEESTFEGRERMSIGKQGDSYVRSIQTAEQVSASIHFYKKIKEWLIKNCTILPCSSALEFNRNKRKELCMIHGEAFIDSIFTAKNKNAVLLSDDQIFRVMANNEGVQTAWVQALIHLLLQRGQIDSDLYRQCVVKMCVSRYEHTFINSEIIMEAVKMDHWSPNECFRAVTLYLCAPLCDLGPALKITIEFFKILWLEPIAIHCRHIFAISVLEAISKGQDKSQIAMSLVEKTKYAFRLLPISQEDIIQLIIAWNTARVI
jgi:hypothetical protein